jgi:lysophospholipase L1-like esterase
MNTESIQKAVKENVRRKVVFSLTAFFLAAVGTILILEIIFRLAGLFMPPIFKLSEIKGLVFEQKPGMVYRVGDYCVRLNREGFRDKDFLLKKKRGVTRIAALGDSMTMSIAMPENRTYARLLEKQLNESGGRRRFEVYNMGVGGYNTAQEWLTWKHKAEKYQPDLVIVQFLLNDLTYAYPVYMGNDTVGLLKLFLNDHSRVYRMLSLVKNNLLGKIGPAGNTDDAADPAPPPAGPDLIAAVYTPDGKFFKDWGTAAARFGKLNGSGTPVLFVVFPWLTYPGIERGAPYPYYEFHRRIEKVLSREGIRYIDVTPTLLAKGDPTSYMVSRQDFHLNTKAHRIIAGLLVPEIKNMLHNKKKD